MAKLFSVCRWNDDGDLVETVAILPHKSLALIAQREAGREFPGEVISLEEGRHDRMELLDRERRYNVCRWDDRGNIIESLVVTSSRRVGEVIFRQAIADFNEEVTLRWGISIIEKRPAVLVAERMPKAK